MIRRTVLIVLLALFLLVGGVAWYLFRPEKAFIDDVVDEPPPPGVGLPHYIGRDSLEYL